MSAYLTASHDDLYVYLTAFGDEFYMTPANAQLIRDEIADPAARATLLADLDHCIRSVKS